MTTIATQDDLQKIEAEIKTTAAVPLSWLQKHERIVLTVVVGVLLYFGVSKYLDVVAAHDKQQASIAQQTLATQTAKDTELAAQIQQDRNQYQELVTTLSAQNAQLAAASASRTVVLQQQQATDKTLPMPELGNRWAELINAKAGDLVATTDGMTVSPQAALDTTLALEQVPVLTKNLADAEVQITNGQNELAKANVVITDEAKQVDGLNTALADQKTADAKELTAVKAQARKGKLHAFLYGLGVGAGAVTGLVVHALL